MRVNADSECDPVSPTDGRVGIEGLWDIIRIRDIVRRGRKEILSYHDTARY